MDAEQLRELPVEAQVSISLAQAGVMSSQAIQTPELTMLVERQA
jgi:hypothetical protein